VLWVYTGEMELFCDEELCDPILNLLLTIVVI